jgi:hypothetical protein
LLLLATTGLDLATTGSFTTADFRLEAALGDLSAGAAGTFLGRTACGMEGKGKGWPLESVWAEKDIERNTG